jgi:hypothetical protein
VNQDQRAFELRSLGRLDIEENIADPLFHELDLIPVLFLRDQRGKAAIVIAPQRHRVRRVRSIFNQKLLTPRSPRLRASAVSSLVD